MTHWIVSALVGRPYAERPTREGKRQAAVTVT